MSGSGLTPLEIASGLVFGVEPEDEPTPAFETPLDALEAVVRRALRRPPCLVSFSGGRDSSCVLALAVRLARRDGLPLPVPATLRFSGFEEADEREWQERVLGWLDVTDWVRIEGGDDLDVVGPVAVRALRGHGLLWPFNAYVHLPLLEAANGGSLLSGFGGDELFEPATSDRASALLARRARPEPRDILRIGLAAAPWRVRRRVLERRFPLQLEWLRHRAQRALAREWAAEAAREPRRLDRRAAWWPRQRRLRLAVRSLATLAAGEDVHIAHPLTAPGLASSILRRPELADADRADRLKAVFGDLLPDELYERTSKAAFNRAFFGPHSRALASEWGGEGVDTALVDPDVLRTIWKEEAPDGRSFMLLQSIWLTRAAPEGLREAMPGATSSRSRATTSGEGAEARTPAEPRA